MVRITLFTSVILFLLSCTASRDPRRQEFRALQKGKNKEDTSFVYALPFEQGRSFFMLQGYYSRLTHRNRAALDFKMKRGTKLTAARGGIVIRAKEDGKRGALKPEYRSDGNYIVIQHDDGSRAAYWHLHQDGALVNVGDTVKMGQLIALSGKTGYTFMPHLHFMVWTSKNGEWQQIATRFATKKGPRYLRPFRFYKKKE